jgi:hypothetical protein
MVAIAPGKPNPDDDSNEVDGADDLIASVFRARKAWSSAADAGRQGRDPPLAHGRRWRWRPWVAVLAWLLQ